MFKDLVYCFIFARFGLGTCYRPFTTVNVNFGLDEEVKKSMEQVCSDLGLSMSSAFTIFAKKVSREKRIPFDVSIDPFYSESNIRYLEKKMEEYKAGQLQSAEHERIEELDYTIEKMAAAIPLALDGGLR